MATLAERIIALVQAIGADVKLLTSRQGDLTRLQTSAKANLVGAINELRGSLAAAGAHINDSAVTGNTSEVYSADRVLALIDAAKMAVKNDLVNGAGATLDTLNEIAAALGNDPNFAATIATALTNRVRYDAAQTLTAAQKTQACANIGVGEPDTDLAAVYTTAKA